MMRKVLSSHHFFIFSFSLALRLLYFLSLKKDSVLLNIKGLDTEVYLHRATDIISGNFMGSEPLFHSGFLYPYFLALLGGNQNIVILTQMMLDAVSAVILYMLGREIAGHRTGLIAGILYGSCSVFIFATGTLLFEPLSVFFLLLGLYLFKVASDKNRTALLILAGVTIAIAGTSKPFVLLYIPLVILFWLLPSYSASKAQSAKTFVALCLGAALIIVPVALRNYLVTNDFIVTLSGGGFAFYLGNNPVADGTFIIPEHLGIKNSPYEYAASTLIYPTKELGHAVSPSEASRFWLLEGLSFWKETPGRAISLTLRKVAMLFNTMEISDNYSYDLYRSKVMLLRWLPNAGIIIPFGLLGVLLAIRRWRQTGFILIMASLYAALLPLFWMSARFRYPLVAILVLMAALSFSRIYDWIRHKNVKALVISLIILAMGFGLANYPLKSLATQDSGDKHLALALFHEGSYEEALDIVEGALREKEHYSLYQLKGKIHKKQGQLPEALDAFKMAVSLNHSLDEAHNMIEEIASLKRSEEEESLRAGTEAAPSKSGAQLALASHYLQEGRYNEALRYAMEAAKFAPDSEEVLFTLAMAYTQRGRQDEAIKIYRAFVKKQPRNPTFQANLGFAYFDDGQFGKAEASFKTLMTIDPENQLALYGLGLVYKFMGRFELSKKNFTLFLEGEPSDSYWAAQARVNLDEVERY